MPRTPSLAVARTRSCLLSTAACAVVGILKAPNSAFSWSRSCDTSSAARGGRMTVNFSSGARALPAMFSQSNVRTSLRDANSSRRPASSSSPTKIGATCAPGASALRSRKRQRRPNGYPARAIMRPSWPAPTMPTFENFKIGADPALQGPPRFAPTEMHPRRFVLR